MRITHVRIRKLVSRDSGYGHDAAEIEMVVDENDDYEKAMEVLHGEVDRQIRQGKQIDGLRHTLNSLYQEVRAAERELASLKRQLDKGKTAWNAMAQLKALAIERGIAFDFDDLPF